MVKDDILPLVAGKGPPGSPDEAAGRVQHHGAESLLGLVGCKFRNADQLKQALGDCGWRCCSEGIAFRGVVRTLRLSVVSAGGTRFAFLLNEWSQDLLEVTNARLAHAGEDADQEAVHAHDDVIDPKEDGHAS